MGRLAWVIIAILLMLWLVGWLLRIAGVLIHLLLLVVLVVLLWRLLTERRAR